jgi:outer membrane protein OmpA-like peptidoglycan-associated protein
MKKVVVILCILSLIAMVGWKLTEGWRKDRQRTDLLIETSDLRDFDKVVTVWGDDWLGYLIFRSRHFQRILEAKGIGYKFEQKLDFKERFNGLSNGGCDIVLGTIDSYLVNGGDAGYAGVITFVIDESFGGDAIVGKPGLTSLDDLNKPEIKGAFVGFSPSEFLLKSQISHFKLDQLLPNVTKFRVDSAEAAHQKLVDGAVDFAVLWEPMTSAALRDLKGSQRLIDTSQVRGVIIDVGVASRTLVRDDPEKLQTVIEAYFETLHYYFANSDELHQLASSDQNSGGDMLAGIEFAGIEDNRALTGLADGGSSGRDLLDRINDISNILVDVGDLSSDPFGGNARAIVNSRFLQRVKIQGATSGSGKLTASRYYRALSDADWDELSRKMTGTLIDKPITFGVGQSTIGEEFQEDLQEAAKKLEHYPKHRVIIQAHVSAGTNPEQDIELSQQRAEAIKQFLVGAGTASERVLAKGRGSSEPVAKVAGEGNRAWKRRCRRAKIFIAPER